MTMISSNFMLKSLTQKAHKYSKDILPSWYVFVFDISVIFAGFFIAYLLRFNFVVSKIDLSLTLFQALSVTFIYALCIWFFKSFHGIIRHTSFEDVLKVSKATAAGLFMVGATIALGRLTGFQALGTIPLSVVLIHFMISYFVLIFARIVVKTTFHNLVNNYGKNCRLTVIYGAGASGMLTLKALEQDNQLNHKVVAFIDDDPSKRNKCLEGVPVFHPSQVLNFSFITKRKIQTLVISIQDLNKNRRKEIIEAGLELNLEVKSVPRIQKWINGHLSSGQIKKVNIEQLLEREPIHMDDSFVKSELTGKTVMITGAAGSIGSGIVLQVLKYNPAKLILLDHAESALYDLQSEINNTPELSRFADLTQLVIASIKDRYRLDQIFDRYRPDILYHAAAYKHVPLMENNPYEALLVNVFGTKALVDLSVKYKVGKFVMVSTDKAVNPTNVMGASKRIAEIYAQSMAQSHTQFITTRFGNVLGSNGSVVPLFQKQIEKGGPVTLTDKNITRYFMTIPEACSLVLEAGAMGNGGEIFVFDMGKPVKIYDLAKKMIQLSGLEPGKDIVIKEVGLREGEKLYEELLNNEENTLPTHHPKILRAKVRTYMHETIEAHLTELASLILEGDEFNLVRKMKQIVPEFISNNSIYNSLDYQKVG